MGISWNKLGLGRKEIRIVDLMDFIFFLVFEQNLKLYGFVRYSCLIS